MAESAPTFGSPTADVDEAAASRPRRRRPGDNHDAVKTKQRYMSQRKVVMSQHDGALPMDATAGGVMYAPERSFWFH